MLSAHLWQQLFSVARLLAGMQELSFRQQPAHGSGTLLDQQPLSQKMHTSEAVCGSEQVYLFRR